jgi:cytidine deaminase
VVLRTDEELVRAAEAVLNPQAIEDFYIGDVGCAVLSMDDEVFTGTCIGGPNGICAEQSAVSNLVMRGAPRVRTLVAVWKNEQGELHVLPPCRNCRAFLLSVSTENQNTEIILGRDNVRMLKDLPPLEGWHAAKW